MSYTKRQRQTLKTAEFCDDLCKKLSLKPDSTDLRRRVRLVEEKKRTQFRCGKGTN